MAAPTITAVVGGDHRTVTWGISASDAETVRDVVVVCVGRPFETTDGPESWDRGEIIYDQESHGVVSGRTYDCYSTTHHIAVFRQRTGGGYHVVQQVVWTTRPFNDLVMVPANADVISYNWPFCSALGVGTDHLPVDVMKVGDEYHLRFETDGNDTTGYPQTLMRAGWPTNQAWELTFDMMDVEYSAQTMQWSFYGGGAYYTWGGMRGWDFDPDDEIDAEPMLWSFPGTQNQPNTSSSGGGSDSGQASWLAYAPGEWVSFKFIYDPGLESDDFGHVDEYVKRSIDPYWVFRASRKWAKDLGGPSLFLNAYYEFAQGYHYRVRNIVCTAAASELVFSPEWSREIPYTQKVGIRNECPGTLDYSEWEAWFGWETTAGEDGDPRSVETSGTYDMGPIEADGWTPVKARFMRYDSSGASVSGGVKGETLTPIGAGVTEIPLDGTQPLELRLTASRTGTTVDGPRIGAIVVQFEESAPSAFGVFDLADEFFDGSMIVVGTPGGADGISGIARQVDRSNGSVGDQDGIAATFSEIPPAQGTAGSDSDGLCGVFIPIQPMTGQTGETGDGVIGHMPDALDIEWAVFDLAGRFIDLAGEEHPVTGVLESVGGVCGVFIPIGPMSGTIGGDAGSRLATSPIQPMSGMVGEDGDGTVFKIRGGSGVGLTWMFNGETGDEAMIGSVPVTDWLIL